MEARPVLVAVRALGLGDLLTAVPALRALADAFPSHRRMLAVPAALASLARLTGAVDEVISAAPLAPLPDIAARPDIAVNLHGRGPESHRVLLRLRPRRLIAFANPAVAGTAGFPAWRPDEPEVERWCRLLRESGIPADSRRLDLVPPPGAVPDDARGATLIHPGAASVARRWPAERWAAVARAEHAAGRRVVITGGPDEMRLAYTVARAAGLPGSAVHAGRTDVLDLARLVAVSARVVCGDTGVGHLATALRRPSVLLFGPSSPAHWGPPPDRSWHRVLWHGRTGDPHGSDPDAGLLDVDVAAVLDALATLPTAPSRADTDDDRVAPAAVATRGGVSAARVAAQERARAVEACEGVAPARPVEAGA